ncbi:unnamed protein product, partial [Prorocentrum cordatum]
IREESYKQFEHQQRHQLQLAEKLAYEAQRREHDKTFTYQQEVSETHVMMEQAESTRRNQREYWETLKAQDAEMQQLKIIMETPSSYDVSNLKCSSFVNTYKLVNASKLLNALLSARGFMMSVRKEPRQLVRAPYMKTT